MTPRRILLPGWKVKAIRKGATQLRVVIKDSFYDLNSIPQNCMNGFVGMEDGCAVWEVQQTVDSTHRFKIRCPYPVGSRLWVPETWACPNDYDGQVLLDGVSTLYKAGSPVEPRGWRSPVTMPRERSRILIQVTDVRVQQVCDTSESDSEAEGMVLRGRYWDGCLHPVKGVPRAQPNARYAFSDFWDSTHPKPEEKWAANPWVFVIEFKDLTL